MKTGLQRGVHAGALVAALFCSACGNMKDQPNPRPLDPAPESPDATSARPWPAHTIARGAPAPTGAFETGLASNGAPLAHAPLAFTATVLERGRDRFSIYCAVCHGADGYGRGIVVRRGFPPPPSYHDDRLRAETDGHLFDVITRGYGVMPPFADRLNPADRWAVVGYVRALQRSQHATLADVPPGERNRLE